MECMMRLKSASAAIVFGFALMLSACETEQAAPADPSAVVAIGDASATLISAMTDPCKLALGDPYWKRYGGEDSPEENYEQRCGHPPPH
jgi:hypothetical protein